MSDQKQNALKQELLQLTSYRVELYISREEKVEEILRVNPDYPNQAKEDDRKIVLHQVQELEKYFELVFPFIKGIKSYVLKITDQNRATACYLLFGKISNSFRALFLLSREGFSHEVMEIIRSIHESLDLIQLFLVEEEGSAILKKWFSGEVVGNSNARDSADKFVNKDQSIIGAQIPFKEAKAHLYRIFSLYTHTTYAALLDSIEVYSRDFDFEKVSGFWYMKAGALSAVLGALVSTIIALKQFYFVARDENSFRRLDSMLNEFSPQQSQRVLDENTKKELIEYFEQFRKR